MSLQTPGGNSRYPSATVRLDHVQSRLDALDHQEVRIPPAQGENDLMLALSGGDVWLWIRAAGRVDGGADAAVDLQRLRDALTVETVVDAKVRSLGNPYSDGTPRLEINLPSKGAEGMAFVRPEQTAITLRINGADYKGSVLANKPTHDTIWISPTVSGPKSEGYRLGRVLTDAGFARTTLCN